MISKNEIVHKRHESFNTPENIVFELVKKATGTEPIKREKIVRGYDNEVYRIETKEGKEFIVRIRRFGEISFQQEKWAMEQCRAVKVPVPKIFLIDTIPAEDITLEAMVLNKLEGQPLAELKKKLTEQELKNIIVEAGEILARINSIKVGGFYRRHDSGEWDFPDWESELNSFITERYEEKQLILDAGFSNEDFEFMLEMMKKYKKEFPCKEPVLCHGDCSSEHIFVNRDLKICGIIDFGMFQGAPPIHDLAYLSFQEPTFALTWLREGYEREGLSNSSKTSELEVALHKLTLQMEHLAYNRKIGDWKPAEFNRQALEKTVQSLRSMITVSEPMNTYSSHQIILKSPTVSYSMQQTFMPSSTPNPSLFQSEKVSANSNNNGAIVTFTEQTKLKNN